MNNKKFDWKDNLLDKIFNWKNILFRKIFIFLSFITLGSIGWVPHPEMYMVLYENSFYNKWDNYFEFISLFENFIEDNYTEILKVLKQDIRDSDLDLYCDTIEISYNNINSRDEYTPLFYNGIFCVESRRRFKHLHSIVQSNKTLHIWIRLRSTLDTNLIIKKI